MSKEPVKVPHKGEEIDPDQIEIAQIVKGLPPNKQLQIIAKFSAVSKHHSGPLPDSETIRVYNECIPNGGDRLMNQVESQQTHRFNLENIGLRRSYNQSSTGQWMAFTIALAVALAAWDLIKSNHDFAGGLLGTADLVGLIYVFIQGKKRQ